MSKAWKPDYGDARLQFPFAVYFSEEEDRLIPVYIVPGYEDDMPESLKENGEPYNSERHDGKLLCPDGCNARLHYCHGFEADGRHQQPHFKTLHDAKNPKLKHRDDCKYKPVKPYLIEVDMAGRCDRLHEVFHHRSRKHISNQLHHPSTREHYASLKGRQKIQMRTPQDFADIIARGQFDRISNAIFIDQHRLIDEHDFFIRYSRNPARQEFRFINLFKRLENERKGHLLPVMMEFQITKDLKERRGNEHKTVTSRSVFYYQEANETGYDGVKHYIVPRAVPYPVKTSSAERSFPDSGHHLVIGYARLGEQVMRDDAFIHYIDIEIRHSDQVLKADIGEIIGNRKQSRQAEQADLFLPPSP
ncbi:MAG: hypothetical protein DI586_01075 [Micavibrio aeruginosavorus]|uniref:Uncharacterized protein n=1 Tax=Micavibrio aeruginosavorus TaxID=349221 RepID=A0A2W5FRZ7_9BACT|nr:MAG: hypothetical protein DI586_01075 [Micavibrio aeruginosavorus]